MKMSSPKVAVRLKDADNDEIYTVFVTPDEAEYLESGKFIGFEVSEVRLYQVISTFVIFCTITNCFLLVTKPDLFCIQILLLRQNC